MVPAPPFSKDERVLCFHQELLYEAKILDVKLQDPSDKKSSYLFKVHYKGWKNTWDDWVPQDRLRKFTEENQELAKNLKKEMDALRNQNRPIPKPIIGKRKPGDLSARGSEERSSATISGKKRGRDFETEREETFNAKPAIRIVMPDALKSILVDDWENVTKSLGLVPLPSKTPVSLILEDYVEHEMAKRTEGSADADILEEVIAGIKEYFNKCLGRLLLYRFERPQYQDLLARVESTSDDLAGRPLADIYGAEHLLRLFVTLPELIAQTNMDQQSVNRLREELCKLTMWMSKLENINRYLSVPYENQDATYHERASN